MAPTIPVSPTPNTNASHMAELSQQIVTQETPDGRATIKDANVTRQQTNENRQAAEKKSATVRADTTKTVNKANNEAPRDALTKESATTPLQALTQIAVGARAQPGSDGSASAGIEAFSALASLLGPPKPNMAEVFAIRDNIQAQATFSAGLAPQTLSVLAGFVANDPHVLAQLTHSQLLQPQETAIDARPRRGEARATQNTESASRGEQQRAKLERYKHIVETLFAKSGDVDPKRLLAQQPKYVAAAAEAHLPELKAAVKLAVHAIDSALLERAAQSPNDKEIVLPGPILVQTETALRQVVSRMTPVEKRLAAVKKDPAKLVELQQAVRALRQGGNTKHVSPEILDLAREVVPHSEAVRGLRQDAGAPPSGESGFAHGPDIATADIGMLVYWIMLQVSDAATQELRDIMGEMQKALEKKKIERAKLQKMRSEQTEIGNAIETEYRELRGTGMLQCTLEEYRAWRPVQHADDGSAQLPAITAEDIPLLLREGPPPPPKTEGTGETTAPDFHKLDAATAKVIAAKYGISEGDVQALYAFWDEHPQFTDAKGNHDGAAFEAYLEGNGKIQGKNFLGRKGPGCDQVMGPGLVPAGSPPDPKITAENQGKLTIVCDKIVAGGKLSDGLAADKYKKAKAAVEAAENVDSAKIAKAETLATQIAFYEALGPQFAGMAATLRTQLKGLALNGAESKQMQEWQQATLAPMMSQLADYMKQVQDYISNYENYRANWNKASAEDGYVGHHAPANIGIDSGGIYFVFDNSGGNVGDGDSGPVHWKLYPGQDAAVEMTDYDEWSGNEHQTISLGGPPSPPGGLGDLFKQLGQALEGAGKSNVNYVPNTTVAGQMNQSARNIADKLKAGTYDLGLPPPTTVDQKTKDAAEGEPPGEGFATQLGKQWKSQRSADELQRKAEAEAAKTKQQASDKKLDDTSDALSGLGQGGVAVDANGYSADGRSWRMGTEESFANEIQRSEENLDTMGDMTDLIQTRLQLYMDRRQKALETLSNIMKKMSETMQTLASNQK